MNWDDVSDFEINKATAKCSGFELSNYFNDNYGYVKSKKKGLTTCLERLSDYCNSWADIGPLIQSISEDLFSKPDWCLLNNNLWEYWIDACSGNMCRAAAIVYLESKGIKPEDCK